jgi:hypothetical protein
MHHTVVCTPQFLTDAAASGMTDEEQEHIVSSISANPLVGDIMPGTGGCRKRRFPRHGKGKRGGYRTVHYYAGDDIPVVLLAVIHKGERANLSKAEQNALRLEMASYADDYRKGVRERVTTLRR